MWHFCSKHIKTEYWRHFCSCCAFGPSRKWSMDQRLDSKGHKKKAKGKRDRRGLSPQFWAAPAICFSDSRKNGTSDLYVSPPKEAVEYPRKKEEPKAPVPSSSSTSSLDCNSEMEDYCMRRVKSKVNLVKELDCSYSSDSGLETPDCVIIEEDEAVVPVSKAPKLEMDKSVRSGHPSSCTEDPKAPFPSKVAKSDLPVPNKVPERPMATVITHSCDLWVAAGEEQLGKPQHGSYRNSRMKFSDFFMTLPRHFLRPFQVVTAE